MKILNTSSLAFTILCYVQAAALIGDLEPADLVGVVIGEVLAGLPNLQEQVGILCKDEIVGNSKELALLKHPVKLRRSCV